MLLIVGGADTEVLELNRRAQAELGGKASLAVVPGATHLFEEPGALEAVARLAASMVHGASLEPASTPTAASARPGSSRLADKL